MSMKLSPKQAADYLELLIWTRLYLITEVRIDEKEALFVLITANEETAKKVMVDLYHGQYSGA